MWQNADTLFMVVAVLIFFVITKLVQHEAAKQRTRRIRRIAEHAQCRFSETLEIECSPFAKFKLFDLGHSPEIQNAIAGECRDLSAFAYPSENLTTQGPQVVDHISNSDMAFVMFDFAYSSGYGRHETVHTQTVAAVACSFDLPRFMLRPERLSDVIAGYFGYDDIDFPNHPLFSSRYLLKSNDAYMVRQIFDDELIGLLGSEQDLAMEFRDGQLLVFYPYQKAYPGDFFRLLNLALNIRLMLTKSFQ